MKKYLLISLFFCLFFLIKKEGISQQTHFQCGTATPSANEIELTQQFIKNFQSKAQNLRPSADPINIPIKLHVVVPDNGNPLLAFFTTKAFNQSLAYTNSLFKKINIQFYVTGAINYIRSSKHQNLVINSTDFVMVDGYAENRVEQELCVPHEIPNAINVFFVNNLTLNGGSSTQNYAKLPNTTSVTKLSSYRIMMNGLSIGGDAITINPVIAHEIGHFLSLHHPFDEIGGKELVTRGTGSNCDKTGDLLCDTPADPFNQVSAADKLLCGELPPNYKDANGEIYKPDMTNIMTYYRHFCKKGFTQGQYDRMLAGLALRKTNATFGNLDAPDVQVNAPTITGINAYNGGANYLFFTDNSNNETGFIIERATAANGDFVAIGGVGENSRNFSDEFSDVDKAAATTYYYRMRPSNSKTAYSNVFMVNSKEKTVCIPPISTKCGEISNNLIFRNIKAIGTNLNEFYAPCNNPLNYSYSLKTINFQANTDYTIEGLVENSQAYRNVYAWIDRNRNGVFDADERIFATNFDATNRPPNANFSFPFSTKDLAGTYTIRFRVVFATSLRDACEGVVHGETIDYSISILGAFAVKAGALTTNNYCSNSTITVPITFDGTAPSANTKYTLQLSDNQGSNFKDLQTTIEGNNLKATIPSDTKAGTNYKIKVVSTSPVSESISPTILTIKSLPTADFSTAMATISKGQTLELKLNVTGEGPFKIKLSDGITYDLIDANSTIKISPKETTEYKIESISNACGLGTFANTILKVTYQASILAGEIATTTICPASEITIPFSLDGTAAADNKYSVQISDKQGANFVDIVSSFSANVVKATLPKDIAAGTGYKIRVVASNPALISEPSKSVLTIKALPTADFSTKELTIDQYKAAEIKLKLTGDGPFKVKLSDGQNFDLADANAILKLSPDKTTEYKISEVSNTCGLGKVETTVLKITVNAILAGEPLFGNINMYPNPVVDQLIIENNLKKAVNLNLLDALGRSHLVVKSNKNAKIIVSTKALKPGIYFLQINEGNSTHYRKILKE